MYILLSDKLISYPNFTKFQPEGEKMIVSSFSDPIRLICPPEVGAAFSHFNRSRCSKEILHCI